MNYSKVFWWFNGGWDTYTDNFFVSECCIAEAMFETRAETMRYIEQTYHENAYIAFDNVVGKWIAFFWQNSVRREREAA